ncbi:MAG: protease HtpX [Bdellovibrionota bacterium]
MSMFRRVAFFIGLNILVVVTLSLVMSLFGIGNYVTAAGMNYGSLIVFCLVWGMGGAFISLLLSKKMAKWTMGVQIIDPQTSNADLRDLVQTVHQIARQAGLSKMPEVGYYQSPEVNAFATGPSKNNSLVAVSTGLLSSMNKQSVEGVLAHEVAHIANGDMVTMTLLQGVVNAFVMALARIVAFAIDSFVSSRDDNGQGLGWIARSFVIMGLEILLFIPGSMLIAYFSRKREFRADHGGARFAGRDKMIGALRSLQRVHDVNMQIPEKSPAFASLKISSNKGTKFAMLFSSHPPLETRIERLERAAL